jgi:hypothetical protein
MKDDRSSEKRYIQLINVVDSVTHGFRAGNLDTKFSWHLFYFFAQVVSTFWKI